jgi:hypothetical protein
MGNHGHTIPIDKEYMLIFGGLTARDKTFEDADGNIYDIYNYCERYTEIIGLNLTTALATCGEELLNDIWIYSVLEGTWTFMEPGFNQDAYLWPRIPYARYGHTGSYVELNDTSVYFENFMVPVLRKYIYIYGGFSFDC